MIEQIRMAVDQETKTLVEDIVERISEAVEDSVSGGEEPLWLDQIRSELAAIRLQAEAQEATLNKVLDLLRQQRLQLEEQGAALTKRRSPWYRRIFGG